MAKLFGVNRPAIVKHISNIIKDNELDNSTCSILEQVQIEGNRKVSLLDLKNGKFSLCFSDKTINDYAYCICRGGWPLYLN